MIVFVPKEVRKGENRVAATPETIVKLIKAGHQVRMERQCGHGAFLADEVLQGAGASLCSADEGWSQAELVLKIQAPCRREDGHHEAELMKEGAILLCSLVPHSEAEVLRLCCARKITCFSTNLIPRTTIAQKMDTLSSQASLAGYKAVLLAACHLGRYFPMMMTAAGTVHPAKVVILGAGVAGLQAIATARRLGALVEAFDVRAAVKEQVESLGAKFIEVASDENLDGAGGYAKEASEAFLARQRAEIQKRCAAANVVITTALIPGKKAPVLVTEETVRAMAPGSVIVDLAVEQGGNCALTQPGISQQNGVTIIGEGNLPSTMSDHGSQLFARNLWNFIEHTFGKEGFDWQEEITAGALLTHAGEIRNKAIAEWLASAATAGHKGE